MIDAALRRPAKLPVLVGVDLGPQGYAVLQVNKVLPRDTAGGAGPAERQQYGRAWAMAEGIAYYDTL